MGVSTKHQVRTFPPLWVFDLITHSALVEVLYWRKISQSTETSKDGSDVISLILRNTKTD
uniref:Uncharacterized protein n=1 Tax=Cassava ampelovirus 1 TaxID=2862824 RepID=A0A8F8SYF4_9CLOS|nr:hypothetical protein [Cassava ampelovirus 1]